MSSKLKIYRKFLEFKDEAGLSGLSADWLHSKFPDIPKTDILAVLIELTEDGLLEKYTGYYGHFYYRVRPMLDMYKTALLGECSRG